jgi:BlaI family penicillinase repressor
MADRASDPGEREGEVMTSAGTRPRVAARAVKGIVDWLCNGSVEGVLVGMVDTRMLDGATARRIGEAKKTGTKNETKEDAREGAER